MKNLNIDKLKELEGFISVNGRLTGIINEVISFNLENKNPEALMWISHKNLAILEKLNCGVVITPSLPDTIKDEVSYILVESPRLFFTKTLIKFFAPNQSFGISSSAHIAGNVKLGNGLTIGENVVIEDNCVIGNNCIIGHNTVLKSNTIIGNNVLIGSNNTIGGVGFGYEKDENGDYIHIPHIGDVVIQSNVEIGNNTCIDKGVLGSTFIGENVKIDNLVHIAHGVNIGRNSLIIAHAMVAGSSIVGNNVWVAPGAQILNKVTLADNVTIGMGAVVLKNVEREGDIIVGNPAKSIKKD